MTTVEEAVEETTPEVPVSRRRRIRRIAGWALTVGAALLLLFGLVVPNQLARMSPWSFLRIPLEGLLVGAFVLILPPRLRRVVAVLFGIGLGLLTILKVIDMGFYESLDRRFDPVLDWPLLGDAVDFVRRSYGGAGAIVAMVVAGVLVVALLGLMALAALRLNRLASGHRTAAIRTVVGLGVAWLVCSALGVQILPGVPVASGSAVVLAYDRAHQVRVGLQDRAKFAREAAVDAFRGTPGNQLLTDLRGKDVLLTFVESYGRVALEDPEYAPQMSALLDAGNRSLNAAGYHARSGWLTSPTFGGGSWLAHSTLLSGLWIDNQQRYRDLLASNRLTLNRAFRMADWRTVGVEPAVFGIWPESSFYDYNQLYTVPNLGYRGPLFNFASMPDQYTLSAFQRNERALPHAPVMGEVVLLSSHAPWTPLPHLLDWNSIGNGKVYKGMPEAQPSPTVVSGSRDLVRKAYIQAIEYSVRTVISYVLTYGADNLVLVFLGDHQPAPLISGEGASRDVPITIVAHDPAVLDRIASWGWQDGLDPSAQAPVWRMDTFRDRFLTTFGSTPATPPAH
jgi:hypothetical protein